MSDTATDPRPSHQTIEEAFRPAREMLAKLPGNSTESKRANVNLTTAENYAHEIRDRMCLPPGE
jgi:hypothetical protein